MVNLPNLMKVNLVGKTKVANIKVAMETNVCSIFATKKINISFRMGFVAMASCAHFNEDGAAKVCQVQVAGLAVRESTVLYAKESAVVERSRSTLFKIYEQSVIAMEIWKCSNRSYHVHH